MSKELTPDVAFQLIHEEHVAKWEGGLSDHPADPGGVTNFGISIVFLKNLASSQDDRNFLERLGIILPVTRNTILNLTGAHVRAIMRHVFWEQSKVSSLPPLIAMCAYDIAVNAGSGRSAILLQQTINQVSGKTVIAKLAGNFGPLTRKYTAELAAAGRQRELVSVMLTERELWYCDLAKAKPSSAVFLKGWLNRTQSCRELVERTAQEWEVA